MDGRSRSHRSPPVRRLARGVAERCDAAREGCAVAELHGCCFAPPASSSAAAAARSRTSRGEELDDLAMQAADDALVAILAKLDTFRGASRFTTWAYKFALLEAGVKAAPARLAGPRDRARRRRAGRRSPTPAPPPRTRLERTELLAR